MLEALGNCLLVEPEEQETERPSGLVLPDAAKEKPQRGVIVGVGPKVEDERLREGRTVAYSKYGGTEIEDGDRELMVLREADLIAVVREES